MTEIATYAVHVDLNGNLLLASTEAVTANVIPALGDSLVTTLRGRDQERGFSLPAPGTMRYTLDDGVQGGNGAYAPGGSLIAGLLTRLRATYAGTTYDLFTGLLDVPQQAPNPALNQVDVSVLGTLTRLPRVDVDTALYQTILIDAAIGHVLDAAEWPKNLPGYVVDLVPAVYYKLGEASGDALDSSGNALDATVTIGAGVRDVAALDDAGDGCVTFDALVTKVERADHATIQNLFDGGGAFFALFNANSDGENSLARVVDKAAWYLNLQDEAGGNVRLNFFVDFDGAADGTWQTAVNIPINTTIGVVVVYNNGAVANDPTIYLYDFAAETLSTLTVGSGLTETSTPVGTRVTDVGSALVSGNNTGQTRTFDGEIDEAALFTGTLTAAQSAGIFNRAQDAPRHLDVARTTLLWWWAHHADAFQEIQRLVNTEGPGAAIYEDGTGAIVFKNRHATSTEARSQTAQSTFRSTAGGAEPLIADAQFDYQYGTENVINSVNIITRVRTAKALQEVWSLDETVTLFANEAKSFGAHATDDEPMTAAVTPSAGAGDFTVTVGSIASVAIDRTSGAHITITLTAGASGATVTGLRLRAQPVTLDTESGVANSIDASASITANGLRTPPFAIYPEIDAAAARDFANGIVAKYKDGQPVAAFNVFANSAAAAMTACLVREVNDRVRVIQPVSVIDKQMIVQRIAHEVSVPATHMTRFWVAEAEVNDWCTLDVSALDDGVLGY